MSNAVQVGHSVERPVGALHEDTIRFVALNGDHFDLPKSMTIEDLVRRGVATIRCDRYDKPMLYGEFRAVVICPACRLEVIDARRHAKWCSMKRPNQKLEARRE